MDKFKLIIISFFLVLISGCSSSSITIIDEPLVTEDLLHQQVELNNTYRAFKFSPSIGNGANESILIKTDGKIVHLVSYEVITSGAPNRVILSEAAKVSNNGTEIIGYNFNRQSTINSTTKIYYNPTITNYGTDILRDYIVEGKKVGGSSGMFGTHLILKPNTYYLITLNNGIGQTEDALFKLEWYETN